MRKTSYSLKSAFVVTTIVAIVVAALAPWLRTLTLPRVILLFVHVVLGVGGGVVFYCVGSSIGWQSKFRIRPRLDGFPYRWTLILPLVILLIGASDVSIFWLSLNGRSPGLLFGSFFAMTLGLVASTNIGLMLWMQMRHVYVNDEGIYLVFNSYLRWREIEEFQLLGTEESSSRIAVISRRKLYVFGNEIRLQIPDNQIAAVQSLLSKNDVPFMKVDMENSTPLSRANYERIEATNSGG